MTDSTERGTTGSTESAIRAAPGERDTAPAVGTYRSGDDVVFYDMEDPLAWVQSSVAVELAEMA